MNRKLENKVAIVSGSGRGFTHSLESLEVRRSVERRVFHTRQREGRRRQRVSRLVDRAQQFLGDAGKACLER